MQIVVQTVLQGKKLIDPKDAGFNIVKFLLSVIAMIFDLIFLFQHFVLYRDKWEYKQNAT